MTEDAQAEAEKDVVIPVDEMRNQGIVIAVQKTVNHEATRQGNMKETHPQEIDSNHHDKEINNVEAEAQAIIFFANRHPDIMSATLTGQGELSIKMREGRDGTPPQGETHHAVQAEPI